MRPSASAPAPEVALLLHCVSELGNERTGETERLATLVTNWPRLLSLAAQHAVIPIVSRRLAQLSLGVIPPDALTSFQAAARQGAVRGLELAGRLVSVVQELERRGVDSLPVKGPTLAALVYGDLSLRLYEDLDVLVHRGDVARGTLALEELGFRRLSVFNDSRDSLLQSSHHEAFLHPESSIPFELHWSLSHRTLTSSSLEERWWDGRQIVNLGGASIRTLGPEALLLYLSIHGAKHSWARIGWLCDLHRSLLRFRDADWTDIWRVARKSGTVRMVSVGLLLIDELFDGRELTSHALAAHTPDKASRNVAARIRDRLLQSAEVSSNLDFVVQLQLRDRLRDRARFAFHILAEPWPADVLALELPPSLRGAYFVFRPLRLAWRHLLHRAYTSRAA